MTDTEIGYIDYSTMNVDKNASYDSLKDRVVIITGAGQAIGRGYAHYFSAQGAIPVIADINGDNAERVQKEILDKQGKALAVQVDVADEASALSMVDKALSEYGRLDILINNAAIFSQITMAPFWELPVDEWKRAVDVNVNGAFLCSRAAVKPMIEAKWGRIINVSSGTMMMGRPNYLHYITTKAAMIGMTAVSAARDVQVDDGFPGAPATGDNSRSGEGDDVSVFGRSGLYHGPGHDCRWRAKFHLTRTRGETGRPITKRPETARRGRPC